jgi:hypothetical protein
MLSLGRTLFSKVIAGTTLVAALVLAVLPLGQMPKVAGPCGRTLCLCIERAATVKKTCEMCPITQQPIKKTAKRAVARWVFVETAETQARAAETGLAFYPVFNALGMVQKMDANVTDAEAGRSNAFDAAALWHDSLAREFFAPPPKV